MLTDQKIISFLKSALECSIYICPLSPGIEYAELLQAAKDADFFEGEIHDAIPQAATLYWGGDSKILPSQDDLVGLTFFGFSEEPDYRNLAAFHRVFEEMRLEVRQKGRANAQIERSVLAKRCTTKQSPEHDVQVATAILMLNGILDAKDGIIRFVQGRENYGSPGDQPMSSRMPDGGAARTPGARTRLSHC